MKVLYIASETGMAGGSTKSLITMISRMLEHGIEIEVICPDENGLTQWLNERGIKAHTARYISVNLPPIQTVSNAIKWLPRFFYYSWINYRARFKVNRIAREFMPDIIHENTSTINVGYHASKSMNVPYIMHIREFGPLEFNMSVPGRKRRLKKNNTFSIPITKALGKHLGLDSNPRSCQIYDGIVKSSDFRFYEEKKKWFLYAGRIEKAKGISDLLEAYADYVRVTPSPYPLYICGGCSLPSYFEQVKDFTVKAGIDSHIKWLGERTDIADLMAQTVATVMPSRCEGLGRVMPEAMANGSLCVVRNNSGTKEQLDNGLQSTGSPIALAYEDNAQLTRLLIDITTTVEKGNAFSQDSDFRQMIERSQSAVKKYFSEESFGRKILDFYNRILSES